MGKMKTAIRNRPPYNFTAFSAIFSPSSNISLDCSDLSLKDYSSI